MGDGSPPEREGVVLKEYYFCTKGMSVGYQGIPLIKNIEISLKQGEILTLIGPNGAGKSTILKSIAGQLGLCLLYTSDVYKRQVQIIKVAAMDSSRFVVNTAAAFGIASVSRRRPKTFTPSVRVRFERR